MERGSGRAASAGREENNRLKNCRTFSTGRDERGEEAINDFHQ